MKHIRFFLSFLLVVIFSSSIFGQHVDKVINNGIYRSYYCYALKDPLYVTYTLLKGGGDCDRKQFHFTACGEQTATADDYAHSKFEEGHLANAEDFAKTCSIEKLTFCFYNCLPQTLKLNRGIWSSWEAKIRTLSQTQPLFIIAGGIYTSKKIQPGHNVGVPDYCYKIVMNPRTKTVIYCMIFPNDDSDSYKNIPLEDLKSQLGYPLVSESNL